MEVKKKVNDSFKPVTLTVIFHTEEEFGTFYNLMGRNVSVPEFVFENARMGKGLVLYNIMSEICDEMGD